MSRIAFNQPIKQDQNASERYEVSNKGQIDGGWENDKVNEK